MSAPTITEARYRELAIEAHAKNPLISALPPQLTPNRLHQLLKVIPSVEYSGDDSKFDKIHKIKQLKNFVVPTKPFLTFYKLCYELIVSSYENRNPLSPKTIAWDYDICDPNISVSNLRASGKVTTDGSEPTSEHAFLSGFSGMGKTKLKNAVISTTLPNIIKHTRPDFDEIQITTIQVSVPSTASQASFLFGIVLEFDRLLKGTEKANHVSSVLTASGRIAKPDVLIQKVYSLCRLYHVGLVIIDEFQNLKVLSGAYLTKILQLFDNISNDAKVSVLKIGTNESLSIFDRRLRHARRAGRYIELLPYIPQSRSQSKVSASSEKDWSAMLDAIFNFQLTPSPIQRTDTMEQCLYDLSKGIPYILFKLWQQAQISLVESGHTEITVELLKKTYIEHFQLIDIALNNIGMNRTQGFSELITISQLLDNGDNKTAIKKLGKQLRTEPVTGPSATAILELLNDSVDPATLSASDKNEIRKIKEELQRNAQRHVAGQTVESKSNDGR